MDQSITFCGGERWLYLEKVAGSRIEERMWQSERWTLGDNLTGQSRSPGETLQNEPKNQAILLTIIKRRGYSQEFVSFLDNNPDRTLLIRECLWKLMLA